MQITLSTDKSNSFINRHVMKAMSKSPKTSIVKDWGIFLILALLLFSQISFAQDRDEKKLKKLYDSGKYDKCMLQADRIAKTSTDNFVVNYYGTSSSYRLFVKSPTTNDSIKNLKKVCSNYTRLVKCSVEPAYSDDYQKLQDSVHESFRELADGLYFGGNETKSKYFYDKLASLFGDTTDQYTEFHNTVINDSVVTVEDAARDSLELIRSTLISGAEELVGTPYHYGGVDKNGFDCSGYVRYVYKTAGIELPHNAQMQSKLGVEVSLEDARPGDLVFFGTKSGTTWHANHSGLIYGNDENGVEFIHCGSTGVTIEEYGGINNIYWLERVIFVKRILGEEVLVTGVK